MSLLLVGLSYRGAPIDLLERFTIRPEETPKALHHLMTLDPIREAVVLSTCNRTEIYACATGFHAGVAALRRFLGELGRIPPEDLGNRLSILAEDDAAAHLFEVASGISSMVVGEHQILSQVRAAFRTADGEDATGPVLSRLLRQAIAVGRRVRTETGIAHSARSFAIAGAALAREALGGLGGRTATVIGAGTMSEVAARTFAAEGARVVTANRTETRAQRLAERVGGEAVPLADIGGLLAASDVVLTATGSPEPLIDCGAVTAAMRARPDRPLVFIDLAVPRDVSPDVRAIPGVEVRDLDDLKDVVAPSAEHLGEIERVRAIVAEEVPRFSAWRRVHELAPLLAALRERSEAIRSAELERVLARLGDLPEGDRRAIEAMSRAIVTKLLHDPITAVKEGAGTAGGARLARALREMFGLEDGDG